MSFNSQIRTWAINSLLVLVVSTATLSIAEYGLGLLGFPVKAPLRVAHPHDYSELRKSGEFEYVFNTNDEGLRYRNLPLANTTGEYRVLVVGDSFTEGVGINDGERFTDLLEQNFLLSGTPVLFINAGLVGTGPLEYGRMYLHVGRKYHPDALLIAVYANDVTNTFAYLKKEWLYGNMSLDEDLMDNYSSLMEKRFPHLLTLLFMATQSTAFSAGRAAQDFQKDLEDEAQDRGIPQAHIDNMIASIPPNLVADVNQRAFDRSILGNAVTNPAYWTDSLDIDTAIADRKWNNVKTLLTETVNQARNDGLRVAVLYIPTMYQYVPDSHDEINPQVRAGMKVKRHWLTGTSEMQNRLARWVEEMQLPFLDLTLMLRKANRDGLNVIYPVDGHWNPLGHRLAADEISEWLTSEKVFELPVARALE